MRQPLTPQTLMSLCALSRPRFLPGPIASFRINPPSSAPTSSTFPKPRSFTVSHTLLKKGNKSPKSQDSPSQSSSATGTDDPFDFSELEANISNVHAKLKEDLSKLRAGGRFNPDVVENLRVTLEKGGKESVRLGDLAQVVPRGRILNVVAGEKDHIKTITSAIQSSDLSLTPQTDPQNPLQLNIPLPPPNKESRQQAVQAAGKAADAANTAIRNARQMQQKKLRSLQLGKAARPDDLKKAGDRMEKVVEKGTAEAKKIVDSAKKVLESG